MEISKDFINPHAETSGIAQARTRERKRCCNYPAARHEGQKSWGEGPADPPFSVCLGRVPAVLPYTGDGTMSLTAARMKCQIPARVGVMLTAPRPTSLIAACPVPGYNPLSILPSLILEEAITHGSIPMTDKHSMGWDFLVPNCFQTAV